MKEYFHKFGILPIKFTTLDEVKGEKTLKEKYDIEHGNILDDADMDFTQNKQMKNELKKIHDGIYKKEPEKISHIIHSFPFVSIEEEEPVFIFGKIGISYHIKSTPETLIDFEHMTGEMKEALSDMCAGEFTDLCDQLRSDLEMHTRKWIKRRYKKVNFFDEEEDFFIIRREKYDYSLAPGFDVYAPSQDTRDFNLAMAREKKNFQEIVFNGLFTVFQPHAKFTGYISVIDKEDPIIKGVTLYYSLYTNLDLNFSEILGPFGSFLGENILKENYIDQISDAVNKIYTKRTNKVESYNFYNAGKNKRILNREEYRERLKKMKYNPDARGEEINYDPLYKAVEKRRKKRLEETKRGDKFEKKYGLLREKYEDVFINREPAREHNDVDDDDDDDDDDEDDEYEFIVDDDFVEKEEDDDDDEDEEVDEYEIDDDDEEDVYIDVNEENNEKDNLANYFDVGNFDDKDFIDIDEEIEKEEKREEEEEEGNKDEELVNFYEEKDGTKNSPFNFTGFKPPPYEFNDQNDNQDNIVDPFNRPKFVPPPPPPSFKPSNNSPPPLPPSFEPQPAPSPPPFIKFFKKQ